MKYFSSFGVVTTGALLLAGLVYGCGPDSSDPESGDTGGTTGTGGADQSGGNGGATTGGGGSGSECPAVDGPLLTDFSEMTVGDSWTAGDDARTFGESGVTGVSGGTFHYQGQDASALTSTVTADGALELTATIAANDYAGFGLWFPNLTAACSDASQYTGISFDLTGEVGNVEIQVQLQHKANYPIEGDKGACPFTSDDTKWDECTNNSLTLEGQSGTIELPFTDFTGGMPEDTLNPAELVGLQWQFNCGDAECTPDLILDNITFY